MCACLSVCMNGSMLTTCPCHHPLRFPSLLPHVAPGNRGRRWGCEGMDSDHLSVARRSMELEGRREGGGWGGWGSGARLNMWPTVTGAWLNMQPFYLPTENTHPTSPRVTRPLLTNGWFWSEPGHAEAAVLTWNMQFTLLTTAHMDALHAWMGLNFKICSYTNRVIELETEKLWDTVTEIYWEKQEGGIMIN